MSTYPATSEFKKQPMFELHSSKACDDEYPVVRFGMRKAKAILENMDALKEFVEENDSEEDDEEEDARKPKPMAKKSSKKSTKRTKS